MSSFKTNLRGVYTIWYRDILRFWRDRARLLSSFAMPVLYLVIFGTGIASAFPTGDFDYISFMYPGIIAMVVIMSALMSGVTVVFDREFGFLKEVLVAPISRTSVVIGKVLGGATIATIQGLVMLVFIPFADVSVTVGGGFQLVGLMFLVALAITSMGLFIASRIRSMEAFQAIMQLLMFPLVFISPIMFPVDRLPDWLGWLVKFNPISYGVDSMRQAVMGSDALAIFGISINGYHMPVILDAAVVVVFGLIMGALAIRSFSVQE